MTSTWHRRLARAADRVLDPTVVFSFDRTGFSRHAVNFVEGDLEVDLTGQEVLVTGANSGLGKETARQLARRGARVWMLCRSQQRGEEALQELRADTGGDLRLVLVDLSDLDSVDACLDRLPNRVDVLVHNAGVLVDERQLSPQGIETTLATHLVGPFRLTMALVPRLERDPGQAPARIVWVSSGGMYTRKLSVERLARRSGGFDGVKAYADVKRAQVVVSEQLADLLEDRGIASNAMHPGWADTRGVRRSIPTFHRVTRGILRDVEQGADTIVWLAACPRIARETGKLWFDRREVSPYLLPGTEEAPEERRRLWQALLEWSGVGEGSV